MYEIISAAIENDDAHIESVTAAPATSIDQSSKSTSNTPLDTGILTEDELNDYVLTAEEQIKRFRC
jgi:hypothetical protein